jgi:hypothetical protein
MGELENQALYNKIRHLVVEWPEVCPEPSELLAETLGEVMSKIDTLQKMIADDMDDLH